MPRANVRRTNEWDAPSMLKVYAPYVGNGTSLDDVETPPLLDFVARVDKYTYSHGWVVGEVDGVTAGFAYISENADAPEDIWSRDARIYVAEEFWRRKIGSAIYKLLLDILVEAKIQTVNARIKLPNAAAVEFHKKHGFGVSREEKGICVMSRTLNTEIPENMNRPEKAYLVLNDMYVKSRAEAEAMII